MEKTASGPDNDPFHPAGTFSLSGHARQLEDAMKAPNTPGKWPTDLPARSSGSVKGGKWVANDNIPSEPTTTTAEK